LSDETREATDLVFDLIKLKKVNPWDVKISGILKQLSKELREKGYLQFTLSGLVLLASSIIYLRKTEALLSIDTEKRKAQVTEEEALDIPADLLDKISPLEAPIRPAQPVIDLEHLVKALSEILEKAYLKKPLEEEPLPPIVPQTDDFIRDIEKKVEDFKNTLYEIIRQQGRVSIGSLLEGKKSLDAARTFILILFILSEPDFDVFFEDNEYYIVMMNGFEEHGIQEED
jgi:chromatin segregation and condensation protein Rec8/ScpA/Scc1 (kleisin family)